MDAPLAFFHIGNKAVNLAEISHWWVAEGASNGPALVIVMSNGGRVHFDVSDGGGDGFSAEKQLLAFIDKVGRK